MRNGAATQRYTTDSKVKPSNGRVFRELALSMSAQKIQTTIENISHRGACDTSRTANVQRKDATIEQARSRIGSSDSSMVIYDRIDEDVNVSQTVLSSKSKPGITSKAKMSSQLQKRLKLSIERISKTPALKVPGANTSQTRNSIGLAEQQQSSRSPRPGPLLKKSGQLSQKSKNATPLKMLLRPTPIKYEVSGASPMRSSLISQQYTTANST